MSLFFFSEIFRQFGFSIESKLCAKLALPMQVTVCQTLLAKCAFASVSLIFSLQTKQVCRCTRECGTNK